MVIESRPALQVMTSHDDAETLHFVDPPYLPETRKRTHRRSDNGGVYRHELTGEDHCKLLDHLCSLKGMVILCGYPSEIYDQALVGWHRVERAALADGALPRTEVLWINPAATLAARAQPDLFEMAAA